MEVQLPQQSVQINLNNKIITLHNVTILKNPRIVKVDAAQYSNLLKGAAVGGGQIKLVNGATNALKFPMPSLVPMKSLQAQAPALIKTTPVYNQASAPSVIVNQTPVIKQATNFVSNQLIRTFQPAQQTTTATNGTIQMKPMIFTSQNPSLVSPVKIQTIPVKPTVIISPQKTTSDIAAAPKKILSSDVTVQQQQLKICLQPPTKSPPPLQSISPQPVQIVAANQTSVITKPPIQASLQSSSSNIAPVLPIKTKVIVSPPLKTKSLIDDELLPEAKKRKEDIFDNPQEHMNTNYNNEIPSINEKLPEQKNERDAIAKSIEESLTTELKSVENDQLSNHETSSSSSSSDSSSSEDEDDEMTQDDDEEEVNDLIMDLENTQEENTDTEDHESESDDDGDSSQARTSTPESPEFEEHVPSQNDLNVSTEEAGEQYDEDDYDIDLLCLMLEPFVDLQCEDDEAEHSQEESEAMKLYREAMEINYQQNGIKKRGRRKSRTPKVNDPMNGILANFLDAPIKIPQGPGRGRRKEINEQELEEDRNNGICFFQCTQCDKSFKLVGDLARHTRSHTISSPYRCSICSKVFTHIGSLNTHLRIHSGERPYKCKFCDKSFTQSNSLMVHVKSHLSNKPFSCTQCNKGFLNASSLALHQKTHTGPKAVICPIDSCGKEFRDNNLLEEHMQTHKQSMLYQCSQCLEKFEQACLLVQHVKSHIGDKPFQCTICSRSFTQPGSLNTHLRIHTGERPFSCTQCPKKFTQASSLSVHMKIHGEKEFKCEICSKSYSQEAFLEKHKLKHKENSSHINGDVLLQE